MSTVLGVSRVLLILPEDVAGRDRMAVEAQLLRQTFDHAHFYHSVTDKTKIGGARFTLTTNEGNRFVVEARLPEKYPSKIPLVYLNGHTLEVSCPHKYSDQRLCVMMDADWSTSMSFALIGKKAAIWLNKYELWRINNVWPGREQRH